jgi:ADP-dependent glucokinase
MIFEHNALVYLLVVAFAASFGTLYRPELARPAQLLTALSAAASSPSKGLVVGLGTNVCVDLIVPARDVLTSIPASAQAADVSAVSTLEEARSVFLHHFEAGAAGERSCSSPPLFASLSRAAEASAHARRSLGGNAALMARKLARLGVDVVLGGHIGPAAASLLPASVRVAKDADGSSSAAAAAAAPPTPSSPNDEVHLILEYGRGEAIAGRTASRANRFILTADLANADAAGALRAVVRASDAANAHALVVAGLHMLEPLPDELRRARLADLAGVLRGRSGGYAVHVELASSADPAWTRLVADTLFPLADSVGFNEVEAAFLYEALGGAYGEGSSGAAAAAAAVVKSRDEVTSSTSLRIVSVAGLLRFVLESHPHLSRAHFHSLAVHVIAHAQPARGAAGAAEAPASLWREAAGAVAAGAAAATTEACGASAETLAADPGSLFTVSPALVNVADPRRGTGKQTTQSLSPSHPVAAWEWAAESGDGAGARNVSFALAPVAACRSPASTVGLGDAISAAGLAADVRV